MSKFNRKKYHVKIWPSSRILLIRKKPPLSEFIDTNGSYTGMANDVVASKFGFLAANKYIHVENTKNTYCFFTPPQDSRTAPGRSASAVYIVVEASDASERRCAGDPD